MPIANEGFVEFRSAYNGGFLDQPTSKLSFLAIAMTNPWILLFQGASWVDFDLSLIRITFSNRDISLGITVNYRYMAVEPASNVD